MLIMLIINYAKKKKLGLLSVSSEHCKLNYNIRLSLATLQKPMDCLRRQQPYQPHPQAKRKKLSNTIIIFFLNKLIMSR